ncbi:hypothetical protein VNI00_006792 [Paramarasmius palmivorus]|uniref:Uncharacterized protein n=1 Tax=Paramarasmius palmivorus TaxID=297713 RepID=A0AAW0D7K2_9AGAR
MSTEERQIHARNLAEEDIQQALLHNAILRDCRHEKNIRTFHCPSRNNQTAFGDSEIKCRICKFAITVPMSKAKQDILRRQLKKWDSEARRNREGKAVRGRTGSQQNAVAGPSTAEIIQEECVKVVVITSNKCERPEFILEITSNKSIIDPSTLPDLCKTKHLQMYIPEVGEFAELPGHAVYVHGRMLICIAAQVNMKFCPVGLKYVEELHRQLPMPIPHFKDSFRARMAESGFYLGSSIDLY